MAIKRWRGACEPLGRGFRGGKDFECEFVDAGAK